MYKYLLPLLLTGCAASLPETKPMLVMHGDVSFSKDERNKCILPAADMWRSQTNGVADINVVWDYDPDSVESIRKNTLEHKILRWTSDMDKTKETDENYRIKCALEAETEEEMAYCKWVYILGNVSPSGGIHAYHVPYPVEMRLVMDRVPVTKEDVNACKITAMHEFGHVLGIPHIITDKDNIMFPQLDHTRTTACLKKDDLLGFCSANDCGNIKMVPCTELPPPNRLF